jgi:hypothetical protein
VRGGCFEEFGEGNALASDEELAGGVVGVSMGIGDWEIG